MSRVDIGGSEDASRSVVASRSQAGEYDRAARTRLLGLRRHLHVVCFSSGLYDERGRWYTRRSRCRRWGRRRRTWSGPQRLQQALVRAGIARAEESVQSGLIRRTFTGKRGLARGHSLQRRTGEKVGECVMLSSSALISYRLQCDQHPGRLRLERPAAGCARSARRCFTAHGSSRPRSSSRET